MKSTLKFTLLAVAALITIHLQAKDYGVTSPDGRLTLSVNCAENCTWTLDIDGTTVTTGNRIGMECKLAKEAITILGNKPKVQKVIKGQVRTQIATPFYKQKEVQDHYNWLTLKMKGGYDIELRAYDQGVAYRLVTHIKDSISIKNEFVEFHNADKMDAFIPYQGKRKEDIYETSFENTYEFVPAGTRARTDRFAFLPILVKTKDKGALLLMESDIQDYPGMFIRTEADAWRAEFPPIPSAFRYSRRYNVHRFGYGDVIARTAGTRTFPWRIIGHADKDGDLPVNDLTWLLSSPSRLNDISWIEPGLSAWDWWNDFKLTGVNFQSGINTQTYLYHIDFAASFGLKYIVLDEGWYKAPDIMHPIPEIDIKAICDHAAAKGIKVILWATGALVDMADMDKVFDHYADLGVGGFKLDFFDGQDALTVNLVHRLAFSAARHHLVLDLHGIYKPSGLNRTWPNLLGFEGVYGLENLSHKDLDLPLYDVTFPYIRQVSGPTDYTPGAMRSAARGEKVLVARGGASQGTRAHQIALYVVLDQPFGILCDSPSLYLQEPLTTAYIASIPTVFDKTFVLSGQVGESIVSVREKDGKWYIGGLTNWDARDVTVDLSFLPAGQWKAAIYKDGVNADKYGNDFVLEEMLVSCGDTLNLHLAPAGGFAVILERE